MDNQRIALLDDHQMFRTGLRLILERVPNLAIIGEAGDGESALTLIRESRPDFLVTDVHLPGEDGISIAAKIKAEHPTIHIIVLSSDDNTKLVHRAIDAGCSGYLLKENAAIELIRALETTAKGSLYLCPDIASAMVRHYREEQDQGEPVAGEAALSARELAVLRHIANGLRNKETADRLDLSVKSVETYRSRILRKLGCDSTAGIVRYAIRKGLIDP